jgi:YidC/Oxa1 family membrane protein insertase
MRRFVSTIYYCFFVPIYKADFRQALKSIVKFYSSHNWFKTKILFYDEFREHENFSLPVIQELLKANKIVLFTSDIKHQALSNDKLSYKVYFIPRNAIVFFRLILFKTFVTPASHFPKSNKSNSCHYVHLLHSIVSLHVIYGDYAFEAYDTLMGIGQHHEIEFEKLKESENWSSQSQFFKAGYPKLDSFNTAPSENLKLNDKRTIIIAPTWLENSILKVCGSKLVLELLKEGYIVIIRPHPNSFAFDKVEIESIREICKKNPNCILEDSKDSMANSLKEADIMISDWSGVAYEFAYAYCKPVIFLNVPQKVQSKAWKSHNLPAFEDYCRYEVGVVVEPNKVIDSIKHIYEEYSQYTEKIKLSREKNIFNLGTSASIIANKIQQISMS